MQFRKRIACALVAAVAIWSATSVTAIRRLFQDFSAIPTECINTGLALQTGCQTEIDQAQKYFNVQDTTALQATSFTKEQVDNYLAQASKPSTSCCKAACDFNMNLCSCNPGMKSLVAAYAGGSTALYDLIGNSLSNACGFAPYVGSTCPANPNSLQKPYGKCSFA